jgi:hypothetical protein
MMRDSVKEFVDKRMWAQIVLKKDYATEESMREKLVSLDFRVAVPEAWWIRNG